MKFRFLLVVALLTLWGESVFAHREGYQRIKVYFDHSNADIDYIRKKLCCLNFVRDQDDADVYIMVRTQRIGSGGTEYKLQFTGQKEYSLLSNEIRYTIEPSSTDSEIRDEMVSNISTGMTMFWVHQGKKKIGKIDSTKISDKAIEKDINTWKKDPWNSWVFDLGANGTISGEEKTKKNKYRFNISAKQVTKKNKFYVGTYFSTNRSRYIYTDTIKEYRNDWKSLDIKDVISISDHWSVGAYLYIYSSDYSNRKLSVTFKPAVEYSFFTYEEASEKQITLAYKIGAVNVEYKKMTIFGETEELLWEHNLSLGGSTKQKWGTLSGEITYRSFLHDVELYEFNFNVNSRFRVTKGLSFNVDCSYNITNNQINIAAEEVDDGDFLLGQKQMPSGYNFSVSVGFSYSFGSIYNAIVNPRFGF